MGNYELSNAQKRALDKMKPGQFYVAEDLQCKRRTLLTLELLHLAHRYLVEDSFGPRIAWCIDKPTAYTRHGLGVVNT